MVPRAHGGGAVPSGARGGGGTGVGVGVGVGTPGPTPVLLVLVLVGGHPPHALAHVPRQGESPIYMYV